MSRIILKGSSTDYQRWELPMVEDVSAAVANAKEDRLSGLLTAEKIEKIQAQAYQEAYDAGFAKGREEGLASGQGEVKHKARLLADMLQSLAQPFQVLDDEVEAEMLNLALVIARQLVRRELKTDPGQVIAVVRESLAALPVASRNVRVCLHPEDAVLVREALSPGSGEQDWVLAEDPTLSRGDCRVLTDVSQVDATLERRLTAVVAQLFGGERQQDVTPEKNPQQKPQDE